MAKVHVVYLDNANFGRIIKPLGSKKKSKYELILNFLINTFKLFLSHFLICFLVCWSNNSHTSPNRLSLFWLTRTLW